MTWLLVFVRFLLGVNARHLRVWEAEMVRGDGQVVRMRWLAPEWRHIETVDWFTNSTRHQSPNQRRERQPRPPSSSIRWPGWMGRVE